jgi:type IV pilus assembly protein PilM
VAKQIWGLDFGDWALKVVRGTYDRKARTITVDLFDEIVYGELPCGYEAGSLEKHREGVIAFREKHQIGSGDDLCVSVTGSEVFSRFINLPPVPESIDKIIGYEARQQIPFDMDDVVWDYQPVKEEHEEGEEIEIGLFALKRERIEELMDLLEPWRGNLRVVQNAPLAVYNLLEYEGLISEAAVVVDVGAATTDVLVLNPPRFWVRTLLVAGDDLTNALVEQFGVSNEEAEKIKRRAARSAHREQILRILQPVFDDLVNEIQRSLGYYKSLARDVRFGQVVVLGSALKMKGLASLLAAGLQYQVQSVRELNRIQLADSIEKDRFRVSLRGLCAALGLLVQGAGQGRVRINMVPEEVALGNAMAEKRPWLTAAAAGLLVMAGALAFGEHLHAQDLAQAQQAVDWSFLPRVKELKTTFDTQQRQARNAENQLSALAKPHVGRDIFLRVLPVFAGALPDDVFAKQLQFQWVEEDKIEGGLGAMGGGRGSRPRAGGPPVGGPPVGGRPFAGGSPMVGGPGFSPFGESGAPIGAAAKAPKKAAATPSRQKTEAATGASSRLVARFNCESSNTSKKYVQQAVFGALREVQFPDTGQPAFTDVRMVGGVVDVYRYESTLQPASGPGAGVQKFLAFEGFVVVNTGGSVEGSKAQK